MYDFLPQETGRYQYPTQQNLVVTQQELQIKTQFKKVIYELFLNNMKIYPTSLLRCEQSRAGYNLILQQL